MTVNSTTTFATGQLRSALPSLAPAEHRPESSTTLASPPPSATTRRARPLPPPKLELPGSRRDGPSQNGTGPTLFVQSASPANSPVPNLSTISSPTTTSTSNAFPVPVPSTSSPPPRTSPPLPTVGGFPPNNASTSIATSGGGGGGTLAARRAAKLGKKRLSLVVPTPSSSSSLSSNSTCSTSTTSTTTTNSRPLLSPLLTPSHFRNAFTREPASIVVNDQTREGGGPDEEGQDSSAAVAASSSSSSSSLLAASETRSLPPSPISLVTFIGPEGSEQPDRTIGRLMLKQQADEMREQMRGKRGMKRRTSIPRLLNLNTTIANAGEIEVPLSASRTGGGGGKAKPSLSLGGGGGGNGTSAVQFLRRDQSEDMGEDEGGEVEEFPYALGPREILPGIYLGSEQNAKDPMVLRDGRFGFVLNVAKEVDCPWTDEVIEIDDEVQKGGGGGSKEGTPRSPPRKHKHRRTKTQAAIDTRSPNTAGGSPSRSVDPRPARPPFIRPTASTPNLQSVFRSASCDTSAAPPPPVPSIPKSHLSDTPDSGENMLRSLSSSPPNSFKPVPRPSPPRLRSGQLKNSADAPPHRHPPSTCRSKGVVRFPQNRQTGRPSLEYLWLKWGHDESDLVEAHKFQSAFDFLDEARDRGEKVLVHCQCGVSRSATVVIAYCMREAAKALEEGRDAKELSGCTGMHDTYSFVKEKSEWVGPNLGLVFQLVAYERTLRGDSNDPADEEESGYPRYPPEPIPVSEANESRLPTFPQTPVSLDGSSADRSEFSTPDLHLPLSPTFSSGTQQSSVTSTPITVQLPNGFPPPRIAKPDDDEPDFEVRERNGSSETLKGEPAVFVLSPPPPPIPNSISSRTLREDLVSPTVASYPSPAPSPLGISSSSSKERTARRPPPVSVNGETLSPSSPSSPANILNPPARPALSLPTLNTTGISNLSPSGPSPGTNVLSPDSAVTLSSDSSGSTPGGGGGTGTGTTVKKFGAQSKSERRASHRRVFSETIQVPTSLTRSSRSSHSLHATAAGEKGGGGGGGGADD